MIVFSDTSKNEGVLIRVDKGLRMCWNLIQEFEMHYATVQFDVVMGFRFKNDGFKRAA